MKRFLPVLLIFFILAVVVPSIAEARNADAGIPRTAVAGVSAVQAQSACGTTYTVQQGDSLASIARRCGVLFSAMLAANSSLPNPDLIYPGQVVSIPSGAGIPNTGGDTYTVVSGDTLFSIARRYNTTVDALQAANPSITNVNLIYPGQVITIPNGPGIPPTGGNTYTIIPGDTLYSISRRYGTTVAAILGLNTWITDANYILPGWVITLP